MQVKSNIEQNIIQIIILAICPLIMVIDNLSQALFYALSTCICYVISAIICKVFNKYLSKNLKVFLTAIISTFVLTIFNYIIGKNKILGLETPTSSYYSVLATICLCLDVYFLDKKTDKKLFLFKLLYDCILFSVVLLVFAIFVELLGHGSLFLAPVSKNFKGNVFFTSLSFKFIFLGIINFILDTSYKARQAKAYEKKITLNKYVKRIRDEKFFQYDTLRRKKLLASKIVVNNVNEEKAEEIEQKLNENETIETEEDKKKNQEELEKSKEVQSKVSSREKSKKDPKAKKFKDSREEKAIEKKPKVKEKKKPEKLKGSVKRAKVERVFTGEEKDEDSTEDTSK